MIVGVPAFTVNVSAFVVPSGVVTVTLPAPVAVFDCRVQVAVTLVSLTGFTAEQLIAAPDAGVRVTAVEPVRPEPVIVRATSREPPLPLPRTADVCESDVIEKLGVVTVKAVVVEPPGVVTPIVPAPATVPTGMLQLAVTLVSLTTVTAVQLIALPEIGVIATAVAPVRY